MILMVLTQMVATYRSTVLHTAPVGAVCSTVGLHVTAICDKIRKNIRIFSIRLDRVYCTMKLLLVKTKPGLFEATIVKSVQLYIQ